MKVDSSNMVRMAIYNSPEEAPKYSRPDYRGGSLDHVCIVRNGTVEGRSTIDLIFIDEKGQKYIAMVTGRILAAIVAAVGPE